MIRAEDLVRFFGDEETRVTALDGISLSIEDGEAVALVGRSGSGKSTLINILGGLDRPSSGRLQVSGREISGLTSDELADYRRKRIGMVFQSFHLVASLSALQNVELPMIFEGRDEGSRRRRAEELLERVGLSERRDHLPSMMSGGEQQRVALARALALDPPVLLADEPAGNLDSQNAHTVMELLTKSGAEGRTVVIVTHDEQLAREYTSRMIRLVDGRVVE